MNCIARMYNVEFNFSYSSKFVWFRNCTKIAKIWFLPWPIFWKAFQELREEERIIHIHVWIFNLLVKLVLKVRNTVNLFGIVHQCSHVCLLLFDVMYFVIIAFPDCASVWKCMKLLWALSDSNIVRVSHEYFLIKTLVYIVLVCSAPPFILILME